MIWFAEKTTKYEREPFHVSLNTWNVSHITSNTYTWKYSVCAASNYTVIFIKKGVFDFECFHKKEVINENNILCIAPSQTFMICTSENVECELYIVEFDCNRFSFFKLNSYVLSNFREYDENLFIELEYAYNSNDNDFVIDSYLIQILNSIKKYLGKDINDNVLPIQVRSYIRSHIHEKLSATQIASVFGYNKDYLVRILRNSENTSLKDMIIEEKLRIVKNLLLFTDFPIVKIGKQIGFDNQNEFHKFFKYHTGTTPKAYRIFHIK